MRPNIHLQTESVTIWHGDSIDTMRELPDNSIDSIVTDPPYGLSSISPDQIADTMVKWATGDRDYMPEGKGFMGKSWDGFVPPPALWDEAMRVLKPGGHLLAFAGARTQDLMGLSIRLAGFEIRDSLCWLFGSGFPKSLDVSKAIDKAAGAEREVIGVKTTPDGKPYTDRRPANADKEGWDRPWKQDEDKWLAQQNITAPATPAAQEWEGWGTALKPAFEPVVVARKPLVGTVAQNVQQYGTGALNIDATRIGTQERPVMVRTATTVTATSMSGESTGATTNGETTTLGRWPANVVLDDTTAQILDQQSGILKSGDLKPYRNTSEAEYTQYHSATRDVERKGDSGGASRFFYVAKAPKRERPVVDGVAHPTVKPLALMRWLVRLVTPPGGVVLDPFEGSGTTLEACLLEGFNHVGIEREADYLPLIEARLDRQAGTLPTAA